MSEAARPNEARQRQTEMVAIRRDELSQTVAELAQRFDVKARARDAVADFRSAARSKLNPDRLLTGVAMVGSGIAAFCAIWYWRSGPR